MEYDIKFTEEECKFLVLSLRDLRRSEPNDIDALNQCFDLTHKLLLGEVRWSEDKETIDYLTQLNENEIDLLQRALSIIMESNFDNDDLLTRSWRLGKRLGLLKTRE